MKKAILLTLSITSLFLLTACKNNALTSELTQTTFTTSSETIHSTTGYDTCGEEKVLFYESVDDGYFVSSLLERGRREIEVPNIYNERNVIGIGEYAFYANKSIRTVTLPNTITKIEEFAFGNCTNLENLIFKGTKEKFNSIEKVERWNYKALFTKVTCDDGEVEI